MLALDKVLLQLYMDDNSHLFSMTDHWRGKGAHLDHRWVHGAAKRSMLDGMTIATMQPGATKEPIDTIPKARAMINKPVWKISNEPSSTRMFAATKAQEDFAWYDYEGQIEPREEMHVHGVVIKPGSTRYEWGVFVTRDKGEQYYGVQQPYFKEFFLYGKRYTGRWIYRLIQRRRPERAVYLWQFGKPIDQQPYVLSRRAQNQNWVPPYGVSCLPPEVKTKIPEDFQYWKEREEKKRLEKRNALREAIKADKVKLEENVPYVLQWHYFRKKGAKPIREGPTDEHWDLRIEPSKTKPLIHFILAKNPLDVKEPISAIEKPSTDHGSMTRQGYLPPGTPEWNPSKETDAWVYAIDKGRADLLEDKEMFKKFKLSGKLKGLYILRRESPGAAIWVFERSELPS